MRKNLFKRSIESWSRNRGGWSGSFHQAYFSMFIICHKTYYFSSSVYDKMVSHRLTISHR